MDNGFRYVKARGIAKESDYRYTAKKGSCKTTVARTKPITGYVDVKSRSSKAFKAALAAGPVSVAIEAD